MNWEAIGAIGEVLGAAAVVVTIVYFSIQLRKTQASVETMSLAINQEGVLGLEKLDLELAELIVRANRGEPLTDVETFQIEKIAGSRISVAHNFYRRAQLLGQDDKLLIKAFATYLHLNPCTRPFWKKFPGYTVSKDWMSLVDEELKALEEGV